MKDHQAPWVANTAFNDANPDLKGFTVTQKGGGKIAVVMKRKDVDLISSAPDLYNAAASLLKWFDTEEESKLNEAIDLARAALAKASAKSIQTV